MSTSVDLSFSKSYEIEVKQAYQRMGSKLRRQVRSKSNVKGSSTTFQTSGAFPAAAHEQALDKLTMLVQQQSEELDRALRLPVSSPLAGVRVPEPGAGEVLRWNAAGTGLETAGVSDFGVETDIGSPARGDYLGYDGSAWTNLPGTLNVRAFGAVGDGVTDDTAAIQAALDAATGSVVFFPSTANSYLISASLKLPSNIRIVSNDACLLAGPGLFDMMTATSKSGIVIEGLRFEGSYPTRPAGNGSCLFFTNCTNFVVLRCRFENSPSYGIGVTNGQDFRLDESAVTNCHSSGIRINDPGSGNINERFWVTRNFVYGCNIGALGGHGNIMVASTTDEGSSRRFYILNNLSFDAEGAGIGADTFYEAVIEGNLVIKTGQNGECIPVTGKRSRVSNNTCVGGSVAGILLWGISTYDFEDVMIIGNTCYDNAQGIAMVFSENNTTFRGVEIVSNRCFNTSSGSVQAYGFHVYKTSDTSDFTTEGVVVHGNNFSGNGTAASNILIDNNIRQGIRYYDNEGDNYEQRADAPDPYVLRGRLEVGVGTEEVESTEIGLAITHQRGGGTAGSKVRMVGNFDATYGRIAGLEIEKWSTFANALNANLLAFGGGAIQEVLSARAADGRYTVFQGGSYNDGYLYFGATRFWRHSDGFLYHKDGTPSSGTDGVRLLSAAYQVSTTWNPGDIADGAGETHQINVPGAALGDFALVSASYDLQDVQATAYVQAADIVEIRLENNSGVAVDLGSGTWQVKVVKV